MVLPNYAYAMSFLEHSVYSNNPIQLFKFKYKNSKQKYNYLSTLQLYYQLYHHMFLHTLKYSVHQILNKITLIYAINKSIFDLHNVAVCIFLSLG